MRKSSGHKRKRDVPVVAGTTIKPCKKCDLWFAAGKRVRVCDGCQRPARLVLRGAVTASKAKAIVGGTGTRVRSVNGEDVQVSASEIRALTLNKPTCGLPRLRNPLLRREHRRSVVEGLLGCSCRMA